VNLLNRSEIVNSKKGQIRYSELAESKENGILTPSMDHALFELFSSFKISNTNSHSNKDF